MSDALERPTLPEAATRRRYLTIFFSDLSNSTQLAAAMEAEHYAELLSSVREAYRAVIPRHGGTIVRVQGDGLLAIFGYPNAQEDDGRRAAEAALELHERVRRLKIDAVASGAAALTLHTGIHSGLVLLDEGDVVRGRFELVGNAPNIAARLSDAAISDEILVSEETLGAESHFFQTSQRRHVALKGKAEPLAVYQILSRAAVGTRLEARAQRGLAPFIGRHSELRALQQALHGVMAGTPSLVAISAPAGVGKSRLADEFLRLASEQGCQVHRGYCESYLGAEPLQPLLQMLRRIFGLHSGMPGLQAAEAVDRALAEIGPETAAHRDELLRALSIAKPVAEGGVDRPPTPDLMIHAVREVFDRLAIRRPQVVFVDDLQWADDATRQVLAAIRGLDRRPILLLIATRGFAAGDADMANAGVIEIAPLSDAEAAETIERLLPGTDPFLAAEICRYAGGSPLFIEELCHSARFVDAERRLGRVQGGAAWLNTLIESRVARLPEDQADLIRVAAVIGNVVPSWLLEDITGCGANHPLVRRLAEQDFIFPGEQPDSLRFKHGITRDVIYGAVGLRERRGLHLRVAHSILDRRAAGVPEDSYEALAYHFGAAAQPEEAAHYAELAGDKAMAASALDRAQAQFRAALTALDQLEPTTENYRRWSSIVQRLGLACVFDPSRDHLHVFLRAIALAEARGDAAATAQSEYWLGYINFALGESGAARLHCERALAAAQLTCFDPLIVQVKATLGQVRAAAGDYDVALQLLDEAIGVKRRHRSSGRPAVGSAYSLACKGSVLGDRGMFEQAHQCFDEALEAVRDAEHQVEGSVRCWRAAVFLWQGRFEEARQDAAVAQAIAERVKSFYVFAMGRSLGTYADWMLDRRDDVLQRLQEATAWMEAREMGLFISLNYGWLAEGLQATGRTTEARRFAARAIVRARAHDRVGEAMAYRALARLALSGGPARSAEHYVERAMRAALARGSPHEQAATQVCQAEVLARRGDRAGAVALLDKAARAFDHMRMGWHIGDVALRIRELQHHARAIN